MFFPDDFPTVNQYVKLHERDRGDLWESVLTPRIVLANAHELDRIFEYVEAEFRDSVRTEADSVYRRAKHNVMMRNAQEIQRLAGDHSSNEESIQPKTFRDRLWMAFSCDSSRLRPGTCYVATIWDTKHINDMPALARLCQFLLPSRFQDTKIRYLPLAKERQNWGGNLKLRNRRAACYIGRPSLFKWWAEKNRLPRGRFALSGGDEKWKEQAVSPGSITKYHNIEDLIGYNAYDVSSHGPFYDVVQDGPPGMRTDYAIVRLVRVQLDAASSVTCLFLSGATSLATLAAVEWAVSDKLEQLNYDRIADRWNEHTDFEVLLEVTAMAKDPIDPWEIESCKEVKICIDGENLSRQILNEAPKQVTLVCGPNGTVDELLIEGDPTSLLTFDSPRRDTIVDLCRHFADHPKEPFVLRSREVSEVKDKLKLENLDRVFGADAVEKDVCIHVKTDCTFHSTTKEELESRRRERRSE